MSQEPAARLLHAAEHGDNTTLAEILQSTPPDVHNASHFTPFILAAYAGNITGMKLLIEKGANIHATTLSGNSAFMMAAQQGHTDVVEFLNTIMNTPVTSIRNKTGDTPLMFASKNGHTQTVKTLLRFGAKPNVSNTSGMTAITCAASGGHSNVIQELIASASSVGDLLQAKDVNGNTALHFAAYGGHVSTVEFLLAHGVSPFVKNKHDKTPLTDVNEVLPTLKDEQLVKNVNACKEVLAAKCKQLEEISQKNMVDLLGMDPEANKKQPRQKKKKKGSNLNLASPSVKETETTTTDNSNSTKQQNTELAPTKTVSELELPKEPPPNAPQETPTQEETPTQQTPTQETPTEQTPAQQTPTQQNMLSALPKYEIKPEPEANTLSEGVPKSTLTTNQQQPSKSSTADSRSNSLPKSTPQNIPKSSQRETKPPKPQSKSLPKSTPQTIPTLNSQQQDAKPPSHSNSLPKSNSQEIQTRRRRNTTGKSPPASILPQSKSPTFAPPGLGPPKSSNVPIAKHNSTTTNHTPVTTLPNNKPETTNNATTTTPQASYILDQALAHLNTLDSSHITDDGHVLEHMYKEHAEITSAMDTIHPNAVALDLPVKAMFGLGLADLSMEQLGVLEETHHKMLQAITEAKLEVVRNQERMRLEEQKQLEIAILKTKLRTVE